NATGSSQSEAARLLGTDATSLVCCFSREHGMPPHRYLAGGRLDHARRLLLADNRPLRWPTRPDSSTSPTSCVTSSACSASLPARSGAAYRGYQSDSFPPRSRVLPAEESGPSRRGVGSFPPRSQAICAGFCPSRRGGAVSVAWRRTTRSSRGLPQRVRLSGGNSRLYRHGGAWPVLDPSERGLEQVGALPDPFRWHAEMAYVRWRVDRRVRGARP
ncbi:MAG: hypothetical protein QOK30_2065, partial [Nocardioidaceae bacterium]|nr:hypothetical protein [Nocardioidaceae bacterium]